jgi:multiple sugar transport system substrate-binding protein
MPLDEILTKREVESLENWLVPAARRLGTYDGRLYAVCNGLDIRALYYNKSILDQQGLQPPRTIEDLDEIADRCGLVDEDGRRIRFGYLPDPRRLWAWGIVFGGKFYDEHARRVTADDERIVAALQWMTSYRHRFGTAEVSAFRQGDQSLPGKTFPLLAGRYAVIMDGQWRVRDISQAQREQELADTEYGVCPLPIPKDGVPNAGWVNGNFFLVPRGSRNSSGAWEFIKFWIGFDGHEGEAATTCVAGGWIPVSGEVMEHPTFQEFLEEQPLFKTFVELAESPNQIPTPVVPGAPFFKREIEKAAEQAMYLPDAPGARALLREASLRIQRQLEQFEK